VSYDIDITVEHPDGYSSSFDVGNMTYNIAEMVRQACGVTFSWFDGMSCEKALPLLRFCWLRMKRYPDFFRPFEASNGWGTYDQFMPYLTRFYVMARLHPAGQIRVS
jgi:hypothetical protein